MRLLSDENFPGAAVQALRSAGQDVLWIRDSFRGMTDQKVLAMAVAESRVLLTFDKDFGELAFKSKLPAACGILLLRVRKQTPDIIASRIVLLLASRTDWAGHFTVCEEARLRMTPLVAGGLEPGPNSSRRLTDARAVKKGSYWMN